MCICSSCTPCNTGSVSQSGDKVFILLTVLVSQNLERKFSKSNKQTQSCNTQLHAHFKLTTGFFYLNTSIQTHALKVLKISDHAYVTSFMIHKHGLLPSFSLHPVIWLFLVPVPLLHWRVRATITAYKTVVGFCLFVCFSAAALCMKTYTKNLSILGNGGFRSSLYFEQVGLLSLTTGRTSQTPLLTKDTS